MSKNKWFWYFFQLEFSSSSWAEPGHFNFRAETDTCQKIAIFLQISQFCSCIMISINFMIIFRESLSWKIIKKLKIEISARFWSIFNSELKGITSRAEYPSARLGLIKRAWFLVYNHCSKYLNDSVCQMQCCQVCNRIVARQTWTILTLFCLFHSLALPFQRSFNKNFIYKSLKLQITSLRNLENCKIAICDHIHFFIWNMNEGYFFSSLNNVYQSFDRVIKSIWKT